VAIQTEAFYSTDVFATQDRQLFITSSATTQWADVFARQERRATAISIPEPRRLPVRFSVDGELIEFTYMSFDIGLPSWATPVLQSLAERWGARPGWDSYEAKPTSPQLAAKLLNIFSDLMQEGSALPHITPLSDGGVQAEWHNQGKDLEIVVPADGDPTYYYFDQATNEEEEGDLDPNYARVQDLIGGVS
jgi:hypothetical protein